MAAPQGVGEGDPYSVYQGDWEGTPPSPPRVAEVQSAPTYWTAVGAIPSVSARRHASSLGCGGVWRAVEGCGGVWRGVEGCGGVWGGVEGCGGVWRGVGGCGGVWRGVEECGGVWRGVEGCGGVWRGVGGCGGCVEG